MNSTKNDDFKSLNVIEIQSNNEISLNSLQNVGHYSLKRIGVKLLAYCEDLSELKYIHLPKSNEFCFDLLDGYTPDWEGDEENEIEDFICLLKWILNHRVSLRSLDAGKSGKWLETDFVSNRGILAKIMCTPYDSKKEWRFLATKFKGTIYFYETDPESEAMDELASDERFSKCTYGGFRFEEYVCSKSSYRPPRATQIKRLNSSQLMVMITSQLKSHTCLYSTEMDGITLGGDPHSLDYVEVKTSSSQQSVRNFHRYKSVRWWAQCFLAGIDTIVCGLRDDDYNVRNIRTLSTQRICNLGKEYWSAYVCLNFLDTFLSFVKEVIQVEDETHEFHNCVATNEIIGQKFSTDELILPNLYRNAFD